MALQTIARVCGRMNIPTRAPQTSTASDRQAGAAVPSPTVTHSPATLFAAALGLSAALLLSLVAPSLVSAQQSADTLDVRQAGAAAGDSLAVGAAAGDGAEGAMAADSLAADSLGAGAAAGPPPPLPRLDPSPPDTVAIEFRAGFGQMAWAELAQKMHPHALAQLRTSVDLIVERDSTGWARRTLAGGIPTDSAYAELPDDAVFAATMGGLQNEIPGLVSSLVGRDSEVIGIVQENAIEAHAIYRNQALVPGAEPEVLVMSLMRTPFGWKVRTVAEIEVLQTALRGLPIPAAPAEVGSGAGG